MKPNNQIRVGILGAAGLSAGKLLGLLLRHSNVQLHTCVSESSPGKPLWATHPELRGRTELLFDGLDYDKLAECDVVFSCKRPGDTFEYVEQVLKGGSKFIDLSGDYRLSDSDAYPLWYNIEHRFPQLLKGKKSVYGLPEMYREEIKKADLIANPGCYTTTSILACAPLVAKGYGLSDPIIITAISGVSGAGRNAKPENQFLTVADNVRAYRIGNHQHTPEIEQELNGAVAQAGGHNSVKVLFVPHVGPYKAGIMADCCLRVSEDMPMPSTEEVRQILADAYAKEPFVRVYEAGQLPQVDYVVGSNYCDIGVVADERTRTIVVVSVTDNLLKGAAGQAVQNMNIMFGFDETSGLF